MKKQYVINQYLINSISINQYLINSISINSIYGGKVMTILNLPNLLALENLVVAEEV